MRRAGPGRTSTSRLAKLRSQVPGLPATAGDVLAVHPRDVSADEVLERLARGVAVDRADLVGSTNLRGGSGGRSGIFVEIGDEFWKSRWTRRFASLDAALADEEPREQTRRATGLYHPRRLWMVTRGADDGVWVSSLTPRLTVLRDRFNQGAPGKAWALYLAALGWTFALGRERRLWLDCNPNNFGDDDTGLYYLDDDLLAGERPLPVALQALLRLREYPHADSRLRGAFVERFGELLRREVAAGSRAAALVADLENVILWPPEPESRQLLADLLADLGGAV